VLAGLQQAHDAGRPDQRDGLVAELAEPEDVFEDYNKRLDEAMLSLIWYDEGSRDRNYYVNEFGRQQVNVPWRLEDYHELLERFDPDDYHFA
jgi:4-hydroxyacetophenone monooxygenase